MTLSVIAELIGIPPRDLERVKEWSLTIAAVLDYKPVGRDGCGQPHGARIWRLSGRDRRGAPGAPGRPSITRLQAAGGEESLSQEEVIALCVMLLFAGHETTVNLIAAGTLLLQGPGRRRS